MVEIDVHMRSFIMANSKRIGRLKEKFQTFLDDIAIRTTHAHAFSANKTVAQILQQENYRGLVQDAISGTHIAQHKESATASRTALCKRDTAELWPCKETHMHWRIRSFRA